MTPLPSTACSQAESNSLQLMHFGITHALKAQCPARPFPIRLSGEV
jgi:hypothetical protein